MKPNIHLVTRAIGRRSLTFKKNSPTIFFAAGIAGVVTSTVLACRATLKLSETLDEIEKEVSVVKDMVLDDSYTQQAHNRDKTYVYVKSSLKVVRLYGPAVVLGGASIACLTGSHVQLTRRNAALTAAYAIVEEAFREYRERVKMVVGDSREEDIYRGTQTETLKNELGKKEEQVTFDPNQRSMYSKIFDECSVHWQKDPEFNRIFIQCQQNYANNLLQSRGHVFLNEVYDMLDVERTKAGAVVGWVLNPDGDNYVDFGLYEAYNNRFINGWERSMILDFNVDGVIYDKI